MKHSAALPVLVWQRRGRRSAAPRQFSSPAAALVWCLATRVNLVVYHGTPPDLN